MAQQDGLIKFKGQMGGISFYKTAEDGYLARQKGGIDAERIKNSPEFERTRENGAEFGRAGVAAKLLRTALRALIIKASDSRMSGRLTREMVKVVQADTTNTRGQRNVIDGEAELLLDFDFNQNAKLNRTLFAPYTAAINRANGALGVSLAMFNPANMIAAPQGATHCRLVYGGVAVDFEAGKYVVGTATSPNISLLSQVQPFTELGNAIEANSTHPIFIALGIEFYQEVNGQMYSLKNGAFNALSLVAIDGGV